MRRVVVTGGGAISALGNDWTSIRAGLLRKENCVQTMDEWARYRGLNTHLAAPVTDFVLPEHYSRKRTRSMTRISEMATRSAELALDEAGLLGDPVLGSGRCGVAYGSSMGGVSPICQFGYMLTNYDTGELTSNSYVQLMPHTTAVNISLFFGIRGRVIPTSVACASGSLAIGYAAEAIAEGRQDIMVAGGAEELTPGDSAVFDTLFATSVLNDTPKLTPRPFDVSRDGLVIGEGAGTLILEEYEHAKARGATILAEVAGFATNCDATHITQPNAETIEICIREALRHAGLSPADIAYISAHGTATSRGDVAEGTATAAIFGSHTPISSQKSYIGHSLGACGALEAFMTIHMQREGWFNPTLNLVTPDPACGELDFIVDTERSIAGEFVMSNNFAFGGINTSLIFRQI